MIPATTAKDRTQLKEHALSLLKQDNCEGLVILINELKDTTFVFPEYLKSKANKIICFAADSGYLEIVKYFLVNFPINQEALDCSLRWSASAGHLEVVKLLVEHGADVSTRDEFALRWAIDYGYLEIAKYLVTHGANIHSDAIANSSFSWASTCGHTEALDYLKEVLKNDSNNNR